MNYIETVPQSAEERAKMRKQIVLRRKTLTVLCFACAFAGILLLVATLGVLLAAELAKISEQVKTILYILTGAFWGGAVLFALLAVLFSKAGQRALAREQDFIERCDGEKSFFVGEGTLATFGNGRLTLHAETDGRVIFVPYEEIRFFSVCTRHAPSDRGEWSVVLEIPARYIAKNKAEKDAPPALVQTDYKPRLTACLQEEGLELIGETPDPNGGREKKKQVCVKKFVRPDAAKRKRAAVFIAVGAALLTASFPVAFWWETTAGTIAGVLGAFLLGRAVYNFLKAKTVLALYREGFWWKESARSDSVFLKWEEITECVKEERGGRELLAVRCAYGAYYFPAFEGAEQEIAALKERGAAEQDCCGKTVDGQLPKA